MKRSLPGIVLIAIEGRLLTRCLLSPHQLAASISACARSLVGVGSAACRQPASNDQEKTAAEQTQRGSSLPGASSKGSTWANLALQCKLHRLRVFEWPSILRFKFHLTAVYSNLIRITT